MTTTSAEITRPTARIGQWAFAGVGVYVGWGLLSLLLIATIAPLVVGPVGLDVGAGTPGLSARNGIHAIAWGFGAALLAMPLGRRLVPDLRFGRDGWVVLMLGVVLAGLTTFLVEEFVRARVGLYEPRATGLSIFAGPALVAVALAAWAGLAIPRAGRLIVTSLTWAAVAGLGIALLPSIPGASDGIAAENIPLAVTFIVDAAYGIGAAAFVARVGSTSA